jgi:hypothetical protein
MSLAVPSHKMDDFASKIKGALDSRPESFILETGDGFPIERGV